MQPGAAQDPVPPSMSEENPFYTPEERQSSTSSRDNNASGEGIAVGAEVEPDNVGQRRPPMSEHTAYSRDSPWPTAQHPGSPNREDMLLRYQPSQPNYPSRSDEEEVEVVSPLAPITPFDPTRPAPMVHYPSWSEVSDFDFAVGNGTSSERKRVTGWHPWRERRDGRYELA
jgi:hypothetical protein